MQKNVVICIGRQFGSGGHEIGEKLAKVLNIPLYDKEIVKHAAKESGIMEELFVKADEKPTNSFLYAASIGAAGSAPLFANFNDYFTNDKLFALQCNVIKKLADEGACVMIGRCADYVLRTRKHRLSVFIHAPMELRIQRIAHLHNLEEDAARNLIKKTDKSRANYYGYYADGDWGAAATYDMCLDAGRLGTDTCVEILRGACELL